MELMYPVALIVIFIIGLIICFISFNKTDYTDGKKVANTKYIKETDYYKKKLKKYKVFSLLIKILSLVCIVISGILVSRPITIQNRSDDKNNRDIIMSLDISISQNEVNLELIKKFRKSIKDLQGDRIGIVIYNTAPVVYCPLTDDYDYIDDCFETLEDQIKISLDYGDVNPPVTYKVDGEDVPMIWYGGVGANSEVRGSSLVGDGLAGTVYSFPDLEENSERTRIIIFATDNAVAGDEVVSLEDACSLCKKYNINLYAYCPTVEMNQYTSSDKIASYKNAVLKMGDGKFYTGNISKMSSEIVDEIKDTKTSLLKTSKKTYAVDHPEIFLIITMITFLVLIIIEKRIKI